MENICPECIASGRAAGQFQGEFLAPDGCEPVSDPGRLDELLHRTPGYFNAQPDEWPSHCDDFCAFLGQRFWQDVAELESQLRPDLQRIAAAYGSDPDQLIEELSTDGAVYGYLFSCVVCGVHRLLIDVE